MHFVWPEPERGDSSLSNWGLIAERVSASALAVLLLSPLTGCRSAVSYRPEPFVPIERGAASRPLRAVAIVAAQFEPVVDFRVLTVLQKGNEPERTAGGAAVGAAAGLGAGMLAMMACFNPFALATCAPVGGLVVGGTVVGGGIGLATSQMSDARSSEDVEKSRIATENALREVMFQRLLQQAVSARGRGLTATTLSESRFPGPGYEKQRPDYSPLAGEAIDAALEVNLLSASLSRPQLLSSPAMSMAAQARLVRALNGTVLYQAQYVYTSERLPLAQWTENNAEKFRQVLQRGFDDLAGQIVAAAFAPEFAKSGKQPGVVEQR